jgi:hypothetical protein
MTEKDLFEAHIKSTAWYRTLSEAAKDDDEGASVFRMARMAAHEAWNASQVLIEQQAARIRDLEAVEVMRDNEIAYVRQKHGEALEIIDGLRAARIAYASEFPPDAEGLPDVGSIHANIRAMKAQIAPVAPAVDAQPVACARIYADNTCGLSWIAPAYSMLPVGEHNLYASAQSERLRKDAVWRAALEEIGQALTEAGEHSAYEIVYRALSKKEPQ